MMDSFFQIHRYLAVVHTICSLICAHLMTYLINNETYTTECLKYTYFVVEAKEPCKDLTVEVCIKDMV